MAAFALAWGGEGFWVCLPGALLLASAEPSPRGGLAAAALVVALAAVAAPPPLMPAALVVPTSIGILLALRSRLERERDAMRRFALRDPLTGVANRRALDERLGYEIARHTRHGESFAVLALDLDGFKAVNDRFGHDAGDELLREAAAALVEVVRAQDTVVRLGGDEFCVLAPQTGQASADRLIARVREALAGVTAGLSGLSASIGTAVFPADGSDAGGAARRRGPRRAGGEAALAQRAPAPPGGVSRLRRLLDRIELTSVRAALEFVDDRGHRDAAQIAYFALLSFIPLGLLLVGAFGLVFDDTEVRERVVNTVFDNVPLARGEDREQLERTVGDALDRARPPRRGLDPAADRRRQRRHGRVAPCDQRGLGHPHPPAAAAAQGARRRARARWDRRARAVALADRDATARRRARSARRATRSSRRCSTPSATACRSCSPGIVILFLYRVLPSPRPRTREIWPGAVVAALLLGVVREALELYFEELSDFGAIYGSLGALMALLVFVFAAANVLVFGAEFASEWSRLPPPEETREIVAKGHRRVRSASRPQRE